MKTNPNNTPREALVEIRDISITPEANDSFTAVEIIDMLNRHRYGDWGDVPPNEAQANADALKQKGQVRSVYLHEHATCVITSSLENASTHISLK